MNYQIMFYGGLAAFLLFLIITVFLFFYLRIAVVIGNLSGMTAKRNIKRIRGEGQEGKESRSFDEEIKAKHGKTTTKLAAGQETTLLTDATTLLADSTQKNSLGGFQKTVDIVVVHSEERI